MSHPDDTIPYGFCRCGCGERTSIAKKTRAHRGDRKGEPVRYIVGHNTRKSPLEYVEEDRGYTSPCWIWQRSTTSDGYGSKWVNGSCVGAHRFIYQREVGPIPEGKVLDHLCRVPACVNPAHLQPVTQVENMRLARCVKLNMEQITEIRRLHHVETARSIAARMNISATTVYAIWGGRHWNEHI